MLAYNLKAYQLSGPSWMEEQFFDIVASVPVGASRDDLREMLQSLLSERFQLKVRHESRDIPGYELTVGKNCCRMKSSAVVPPETLPGATGHAPKFDLDKDGFIIIPPGQANIMVVPLHGQSRLTAARKTLKDLCDFLSSHLQRPVVDGTGMVGEYDFHLAFAPDGIPAPPSSQGADDPSPATPKESDTGPTLIGAVQDQLGLKMEPNKITTNILVVEHAEKKPTEN